jgi:hypothetical protein
MRASFARWGRLLFRRLDGYLFRLITIILIYLTIHLGKWALEKYFTLRNKRSEAAALDGNENAK